MTAILFVLFFLLLALGIPVFLSLTLSSTLVLELFTNISSEIVIQRLFSGVDKFSLMAVPFFILAANVMNRGGLAPRMVKFANATVGHLRGGLAFTVVITCMFLGATSGSAPATVVAICSIMLPSMVKAGYSKGFSIGLIMAASSVAVIIPPSIGMIVYGSVTGVSIGKVFMGGFLPGILYGGVFMIFCYIYAKKKDIPLSPKCSWREKGRAFLEAGWALGIPVIIIGGIYGGFCTPTESAGIAAMYAILVSCFVYRELDFKGLFQVCYESAVSTAQNMVLLAGASVFAWVLTRFQVPVHLANAIIGIAGNKFAVLLLMNVILLIAGMFLDPSSIITIMAPLFLPIAVQFGINPVHLGVIMVVNGAIGMFTPPFGLNLFVASGITRIRLTDLFKTVWIWIILSIVALLLITYIEPITMLLPNLVIKG